MKTIKCEDCGCDVEAQRSTKRFCDDCAEERHRVSQRDAYEETDKTRTCEECGEPFESVRGNARFCPPCRTERRKAQRKLWDAENRERRAEYTKQRRYSRAHALRKYGLTLEQYDQMVEERQGRCDICEREAAPTLCVDHCHETGVVRGLLCSPCNRAIGQLGDTVEHLRRAVAYLERSV